MLRKNNITSFNAAISPNGLEGRIDFESIWGRIAPVEIEIGSGKGTFLVEQAKMFPEINFLGIEWANKFYKHAVDRMERWGLANVRILRTDAAVFIKEHVPDTSIEAFHLYFPDPWPKKKHHKRRFFCDDNLAEIYRILKPDGIINIATDHENYYEQMTDVAGKAIGTGLFKEIPFTRPAGAKEGELVGTNYERKYIKEGRNTYTLAIQKI
ncbi:MAG: tRNA (guanosine(46)-N7)-methyltransferase TrmB [Deltaproteobacteria bacterium]|nr:tRNA (guanosine(46)-N7)-methyltransferase TrmB [Deltaproteobacteria bacterium]